MTRRTALWLLGVSTLAIGALLVAVGPPADEGRGPSIIPFEFAASEEQAEEYKAEWGADGRDAARLELWLDYLYMASYGAFFVLAVGATRDAARRRRWERFASVGAKLVPVAVAAPLFDAAENVGLLLALGGHGGDAAPLGAAICAGLKFAATVTVIVYVLAGLIRRLAARTRGAEAPA